MVGVAPGFTGKNGNRVLPSAQVGEQTVGDPGTHVDAEDDAGNAITSAPVPATKTDPPAIAGAEDPDTVSPTDAAESSHAGSHIAALAPHEAGKA